MRRTATTRGAPDDVDQHSAVVSGTADAAPLPAPDTSEGSSVSNAVGVLYAAVWLVFLALPGTAAVVRGAHPGWIVASLLGIVAFAALYLAAMARWVPQEDSGVSPSVSRMVLVQLGLGALAALSIPAAGSFSSAFTTYLAALVIFAYPPRAGISVGILIWLLPSSLAAVLAGPEASVWPLAGPGIGLVFIIIIRLTDMYERRDRQRQESLRQVRERDAIARDVHDVLGHSLTVLSIKAQLAGKLVSVDPERAGEELRQIDELARESLSQVRSTVSRLRSPTLASEIDVARAALAAAEIEADIVLASGYDQVSDESQLFAWSLREGVTNVVRHSGAQSCRIEITPHRLLIIDDGVGADVTGEGNGLRGLRERARSVNATIALGPARADQISAGGPSAPGTILEVRR
jgi:two-component system sensor histidine kinase DesK